MRLYQKIAARRWRARLFWVLVLLAVWELAVKLSGISPLLLPPVEAVAATLARAAVGGGLLYQAASSLLLIGAGLLIGGALCLLLALCSMRWRAATDFIDTLGAVAHPLPGIAILPLILIWFGTGTWAVVAVIVHACLWPMLLNLLSGFRSAPRVYSDVGRNLSMKPLAIAWQILLPAACPHLLAGLKIGWARAWRALISAEMVFGAVGSRGGIGWYIFKERTFMNTSGLMAGIVVVILLGIAVEELLFSQLEKHTVLRWGMAGPREGTGC